MDGMTELNQAKDKNYFIRRDYRVNPVLTFNKDDEERYWTPARIINSSLFQYHVYLFAREILPINFHRWLTWVVARAQKPNYFLLANAMT